MLDLFERFDGLIVHVDWRGIELACGEAGLSEEARDAWVELKALSEECRREFNADAHAMRGNWVVREAVARMVVDLDKRAATRGVRVRWFGERQHLGLACAPLNGRLHNRNGKYARGSWKAHAGVMLERNTRAKQRPKATTTTRATRTESASVNALIDVLEHFNAQAGRHA